MENIRISKNFKLSEFITSKTAERQNIDNTPNEMVRANIYTLVNEILQPIRDEFGDSIKINSGYRCEELNKVVNGSKSSQHVSGSAADICSYYRNDELFYLILQMIEDGDIVVGQLIWEYGNSKVPQWIHISLPNAGKVNNILRAKKLSGRTVYLPFVKEE